MPFIWGVGGRQCSVQRHSERRVPCKTGGVLFQHAQERVPAQSLARESLSVAPLGSKAPGQRRFFGSTRNRSPAGAGSATRHGLVLFVLLGWSFPVTRKKMVVSLAPIS